MNALRKYGYLALLLVTALTMGPSCVYEMIRDPADAAQADGPKPDGPKSDGPKPDGGVDASKPDGPKSDAKPDAPEPDAEPDTLKPDTVKPDTTDGYVAVQAGTFIMGSPTTDSCRLGNEDEHPVTLTRAFEISVTEVTQEQFYSEMSYNLSTFGPNGSGLECGLDCPVESVSWHEAAAYCNALSSQKGLARCYSCTGNKSLVDCDEGPNYVGDKIYTCPGFRLPTEAEWEYAYRAGTTDAFYNGPNDPLKCVSCSDPKADAIAWHWCNSGDMTHPVKQKTPPNGWGLYDMAGDVSEWCHDQYKDQLGTSLETDPVGINPTLQRVIRGGSFFSRANKLRAASRSSMSEGSRSREIGFRCVRRL